MLVRHCSKVPRLCRSSVARNFSRGGVERAGRRLQFSKEKLVDFGELPRGEIPDALQFNPASTTSTLDNGVTVATEVYNSPLATIGFHWKYGSRHETQETSGLTHFLTNLRFRGGENQTREQIEKGIQAVGGNIYQEIDRERNSLYVTCLKGDVDKVVGIVGGLISNTTFQENQLEAEREIIYRNIVEQHRDMMELTLENIHFTSYRDHQLGQPSLGVRENAATLSIDQIKKFISEHHTGGNLVITATGDVNHSQLVEASSKSFGGLQKTSNELPNTHQALYTSSLMFMADDEMSNLNVAAFMKAPAYSHPDSIMMRILVELMGEYRADKHTAINLNDAALQYNSWHTKLGDMTDIAMTNTMYFGYSDTGLLGTYLLGNEVLGSAMIFAGQNHLTRLASGLNQAEVFRARAKLFNDLLRRGSSIETNRTMAQDLQYLGRVVQRSELATKISAGADQGMITQTVHNWFWDSELSATVWGPLHNILQYTHYNRPWKRSTLGVFGMFPGEVL